jgi:hypothetical protein
MQSHVSAQSTVALSLHRLFAVATRLVLLSTNKGWYSDRVREQQGRGTWSERVVPVVWKGKPQAPDCNRVASSLDDGCGAVAAGYSKL